MMSKQVANLILYTGRIATQNERRSFAQAAAVLDGKFVPVGTDRKAMAYRGDQTQLIDLKQADRHLGPHFRAFVPWRGPSSMFLPVPAGTRKRDEAATH